MFGARAAIDVSRRELLNDLIRPKLLRYPRTATQLLSRIRCAYAHAIEQGRLPEDFSSPTVGIKGASQVRRRRVLTDAELASFLRWLLATRKDITARPMRATMGGTFGIA